ncbi:MAG TPA: type II secretion system protein [Rhodocyclaceae bacterium]|nr:type II secretion system protein [Rhodocyclaceae bacterium]HNH35082.1 type II secretion system protein [Rhodocyclaceae bacterium]
MNGKARGFTLIELVIVITIVGILAAVALPRFVNLQRDARIAKAQAIYGAVKSAAALAKARCELDLAQPTLSGSTCTSTGGTVNMDGAIVAMTNRYPSASVAGIDVAAQMTTSEGVTISGGAPRLIQMNGATDPATCQVSYTAPASVGTAPTIDVATDGC